jgi:hypothetical protein
MVKQRVLFSLLHPGRATDYDNRRFFGKCFGSGVCHLEAANAISDANCAQASYTSIGIRRKTSTLFITSVDDAELAFR